MTSFVTRDGERVTPTMLTKINNLSNAFNSVFGYVLYVTSGVRTTKEQTDIFLSRYVTAPNVRGRYVYDIRYWNGVAYYRISSAGTVAVPGTSNHEVQGTTAAVDLRDSGPDSGVTVAGTKRANWLKTNAPKYGLHPTGYGFGEPWHYDIPNATTAPSQASDDIRGIQTALNKYNNAGLVVDGIPGPKTTQAIKNFQQKHGLVVDGVWGPKTNTMANSIRDAANSKPAGDPDIRKIQENLNKVGYKLVVDGIAGPATKLALRDFQKINGLTVDGLWGSKTQTTFERVVSVTRPVLQIWSSGTQVRLLQQKLGVKVDGSFGPDTLAALKAFQKKNNLVVDGIAGPKTWLALGV